MGNIDIDSLTEEQFKSFPLVIEGESKEVRYIGNGLVVIKFKPTVYSFTANRCGIILGSDVLRLRATKILLDVLNDNGISHAYHKVNDKFVLADLILQPESEGVIPFRPGDISNEQIKNLKMAPPIEVVIKNCHSGTSKHRYFGMSGCLVRHNHKFYPGVKITADEPYPQPIIRFDWRNPLLDSNGNRLADEILPESIAEWFIDVKEATNTALRVGDVIGDFLALHDIVFYDLCLFITHDGKTVFGEISQDCGRFRHFDLGSLDKDVWRAGGSSQQVVDKWAKFVEIIGA